MHGNGTFLYMSVYKRNGLLGLSLMGSWCIVYVMFIYHLHCITVYFQVALITAVGSSLPIGKEVGQCVYITCF